MRCVVVLKRCFRGGGTQTAKPSAGESQRLCLRPHDLAVPHPSNGIGRAVELATKQCPDCFVSVPCEVMGRPSPTKEE
jgi:hypothetical protein